jgi:hypothetical protein
MSVMCLSGRGLYDKPMTRREESYRLWCVIVCDLETSKNEAALAHVGLLRQKGNTLTCTKLLEVLG